MAWRDLRGQTFARLTVIGDEPIVEKRGASRRTFWACRCECGEELFVRSDQLLSGHSRSCGCLQREAVLSNGVNTRFQRAGVNVTYSTAHCRVRRERGPARGGACIDCGERGDEWSYLGACPDEQLGEANGFTVRFCPVGDEHDECYAPRCIPCHRKHDVDIRREAA